MYINIFICKFSYGESSLVMFICKSSHVDFHMRNAIWRFPCWGFDIQILMVKFSCGGSHHMQFLYADFHMVILLMISYCDIYLEIKRWRSSYEKFYLKFFIWTFSYGDSHMRTFIFAPHINLHIKIKSHTEILTYFRIWCFQMKIHLLNILYENFHMKISYCGPHMVIFICKSSYGDHHMNVFIWKCSYVISQMEIFIWSSLYGKPIWRSSYRNFQTKTHTCMIIHLFVWHKICILARLFATQKKIQMRLIRTRFLQAIFRYPDGIRPSTKFTIKFDVQCLFKILFYLFGRATHRQGNRHTQLTNQKSRIAFLCFPIMREIWKLVFKIDSRIKDEVLHQV